MEETLYKIEEYCTTGWEVVEGKLTRDQAKQKLNELISEGYNPNDLRATQDV